MRLRADEVKAMPPRFRFQIQPKHPPHHAMAGDWAGLDKGTGYEFWGLRKYLAGDSFRHIDWKARARSGELYVREFLKDSAYNLVLICDLSPSMTCGGKLALVRDLVESLAWTALHANNPCGLLLFADRVLDYLPPSAAPQQLQRLLTALDRAGVADCRQTRLQPALAYLFKRLPACLGVILSDFNAEIGDLRGQLEAAAGGRYPAHELVALHILAEVEFQLPEMQDVQVHIRDVETGVTQALDLTRRQQYNALVGRWRKHLVRQLARADIDSALLTVTDPAIQEKVNTFFARRLAARV